tara:strand:- start:5728 stop:6624 length:897 start_codon:yes stop_codon:yes gene_type:complete
MAAAKSVASSKTAKKSATKSRKSAAKQNVANPKVKAKASKAKTATKKTASKAKTGAKKTAPKAKTAAKKTAPKAKTATKNAVPKSKAKVKVSSVANQVAVPKKKATAKKPKAAEVKALPEKSGDLAQLTKTATPKKLHGFAVKDYVVYPSHGVGQITAVEEHEIGDISLQVFVVVFDKEKMTLRVPVEKADTSGMRRLSSAQKMEQAISTLQGRARTRRVMWSRRAQEYDAKLNSGDPVAIAEVVRDLHRDETQPDQSYSERQMYEAALERLAREFAAVENTDTEQAAEKLENVLRAA